MSIESHGHWLGGIGVGPESGLPAVPEPAGSSGREAGTGSGGPDRVVHGRDREQRTVGAFVAGLDPTTLVVNGLGGTGKSVTVLAALRRIDPRVPAVRVVRSCTSRPSAHRTTGRERLDLSGWAVPAGAGPGYETDPAALLDAVGTGLEVAGPGPRVLFVDDLKVLSPHRAAWLRRLGDLAYERGWRVVAAARHVPEGPLPDDIEVLDLGPLDERSLRLVLDAELRMPLAADVAERLHWWSAGNPRIALELADGLSPAQQRGGEHWAGPHTVGPAARRSYQVLLDGLDAAPAPVPDDAARGRLAARYPLLAVLWRELDRGSEPALPASATVAEEILDGLHLDSVSGAPGTEQAPRATARAVGVTLLSGTTSADDGGRRWMPEDVGAEWTDHLWWRDTRSVAPASSAAGERTAAALIALERTGRLSRPDRLRADLEVIGSTPDQDWVGVCLQVRGRLLLGDGPGARRILEDQSYTAAPRTVAEIVARDVAAARVAIFSGRAADARERLAHATSLRPGAAGWLPVQGLLAVAAALLDGTGPTSVLPPRAVAWSHRALGEFAVDLGVAHLAVGQAERAAELLMVGLERCSWPYRGRAQARADLVEAVVAAGHARAGLPDRVRQLIEPSAAPEERADADAAAAHARMRAMLARSDAPSGGVDGWLPVVPRPVSAWQRLRSLVAYGRHCLVHGDHAASDLVLREARALARLAGAPGWRVGVDAGRAAVGLPTGRPAWERLGDDEREFVRLALGGATNAQIADAAYLSVRSVANRMRSIYTLLGIRDRRDLADRARVDPPGWLTGSA